MYTQRSDQSDVEERQVMDWWWLYIMALKTVWNSRNNNLEICPNNNIADNFILVARDKSNIEEIIEKTSSEIYIRGLKFNHATTKSIKINMWKCDHVKK